MKQSACAVAAQQLWRFIAAQLQGASPPTRTHTHTHTHTHTENIAQYISECDLNFRVSISHGCWGSTESNQGGLPRGKDLNIWEWEGGNLSLTPMAPDRDGYSTALKKLLLFSRSVMSDSLQPHGLQHTRLPCPSLSPGIFSNSCPLSQWCHPTISSSVTPVHLLPSILPSIRVFSSELALLIKWPKYWSFSFSISCSNEYSGLISFSTD